MFWNRKAERLAQAAVDMQIRTWLLQQELTVSKHMVDWYDFGDFITVKLDCGYSPLIVSIASHYASPSAFSGLFANNGRVSMKYRHTPGNNFSLMWTQVGDKIRFTESKPLLNESEAVA